MRNYLDRLLRQHRRLDRLIDNCRAVGRPEELKSLKRLRLRLKDRIFSIRRQQQPAG